MKLFTLTAAVLLAFGLAACNDEKKTELKIGDKTMSIETK